MKNDATAIAWIQKVDIWSQTRFAAIIVILIVIDAFFRTTDFYLSNKLLFEKRHELLKWTLSWSIRLEPDNYAILHTCRGGK